MASFDPRLLRIAKLAPGDFSFWEFVTGRGEGPEVALAYGRVFWPELVKVEEFVLLSENYDPEYFDRVASEYGDTQVECTINTTYLPDLFGPMDADERTWSELGELVAQCWKARAEAIFPGMRFVATFQWYSENGDPGVSLCQERYAVDRGASELPIE